MKWLLVTNNGNPGDIWVRFGVQEIIRQFDSNPEFLIRERDYREGDKFKGLTEPKSVPKFDYSVICGMPLVWCHREANGAMSYTQQHESWQAITGWLKPERMIIAGFGIFLMCPKGLDEWQLGSFEVIPSIRELFEKCLLVYSRSPFSRKLFPNVASLPCPSVLVVKPAQERDLKLCNFMPGGGHYPHLAPEASALMMEQMPHLARECIRVGYHFAAHNQAEENLALELGWPEDQIHAWRHDGTGCNLLEVYGRCSKYLGNRIHGGIVSRAAGADVVVIGYDTRLAAVRYLGGQVYTPSTAPDLVDWIKSPAKGSPYSLSTVRKLHLTWWSTKLGLPIKK
jgi:hypothetical protein